MKQQVSQQVNQANKQLNQVSQMTKQGNQVNQEENQLNEKVNTTHLSFHKRILLFLAIAMIFPIKRRVNSNGSTLLTAELSGFHTIMFSFELEISYAECL